MCERNQNEMKRKNVKQEKREKEIKKRRRQKKEKYRTGRDEGEQNVNMYESKVKETEEIQVGRNT